MKKLVASILIVILAITCLMSFVGCNNDNSDNDKDETSDDDFVGAISQSTYESVEDAIKGFLDEEISGMAFTAEYVGYTKIADLSQEEVDTLAVDEELKDEIVNIEKCEVEYIERSNTREELLASTSKDTCARVVYIIVYNVGYRFYVPIDEIGQSASASSIEFILRNEKYKNCTIKFEVNDNGGKFNSVLMISDNAIYVNNFVEVVACYYVNYENYWYRYFYKDKELERSPFDNPIAHWLEDIIFGGYGHLYLYNYFVKTDNGYKLREKLFPPYGRYDKINDYEIFISNGRISKIKYNLISVDYANNVRYQIEFSDFGTTKVDVPTDVMNAIKEYANNNN